MKRIEIGQYVVLVCDDDDLFVIDRDLLSEMEDHFRGLNIDAGIETTLESSGKLNDALSQARIERDPAYPFTVIDVGHFSIDEFPFK